MINNPLVFWSILIIVVFLLSIAIFGVVKMSILNIASTKREIEKLIESGMNEQQAKEQMRKRHPIHSPLTKPKFIVISILAIIYIILKLTGLI